MKEEMDMKFLEEMPEDEEMMDSEGDFLDEEMDSEDESPLAEFSDEDIMAEYEKRGLAESSEEPVEDELDFEEDEEMPEDEMPMGQM